MPSQLADKDKEALYAAFSENKRGLGIENHKRAYLAAKEFVRRYSGENDNYVKEAQKFLADFEKGVSQYELFTAYGAKNYAKAFELGRPLLKTQPEDFFVLGVLGEAGYENALAGNASLNDETVDYVRRAIQLVEAGKVSQADPFKNLDVARGFLNLAQGWFLKDKAPAEAASAFRKSVQSDSPFQKNPLTYYRLGVAILKGEFAQLSAEYNEKYGTKEASSDQQAMLQRINHLGEQAIDAYARSYALSDPQRSAAGAEQPQLTPEFRDKLLGQLTALYKSLHNNSDAGLTELISTVLSKPPP